MRLLNVRKLGPVLANDIDSRMPVHEVTAKDHVAHGDILSHVVKYVVRTVHVLAHVHYRIDQHVQVPYTGVQVGGDVFAKVGGHGRLDHGQRSIRVGDSRLDSARADGAGVRGYEIDVLFGGPEQRRSTRVQYDEASGGAGEYREPSIAESSRRRVVHEHGQVGRLQVVFKAAHQRLVE